MASVAVIIPTFNRADLVAEAVGSALGQEGVEVRVILVDDGSTDGTAAAVRILERRHGGRLEAVRQENRGCAAARNAGLGRLQDGDGYVCFLDSDDRLLAGALRRAVAALEAQPGAGFAYADALLFRADDGREALRPACAAGRPGRFALEHLLTNDVKFGSVVFRAAAVRGERFREDLALNEDSEFLQRIALRHPAAYAAGPASWVREHAGSKSRRRADLAVAVLSATRDLLAAHPAFHAQNRRACDRRLATLRSQALSALAGERRWREARAVASGPLDLLRLLRHRARGLRRRP